MKIKEGVRQAHERAVSVASFAQREGEHCDTSLFG
jgi:hypothetical protein